MSEPRVPTDSLGNPITVPDSHDVLVVEAADGSRWELVCGLEVHAELHTVTKMFSAAPNSFGDEPNTNVDPVTLGLPGTLPVVNEAAVELAIRFGCAVGAEIRRSVFSRKNYFYPDMPKNFQISQYDLPIVVGGELELTGGHVVGIERAHLEEDTGKSTHVGGDGRIAGAEYSLVDYNRAGVPLLEIVSRPHVRSAEQARQYVAELRAILVACGVSDGKMEEGSLRVDANISVRPEGSDELRTRCEIKNVNSLRSLVRAIEFEASRQADLHAAGEPVVQSTRGWDEASGTTVLMRTKEDADDYRYFPEPDLVPVDPDPARVAEIAASLPLLPSARRHRLAERTGAAVTDESVVAVVDRAQDDQAVAAMDAGGDPARVLVHVTQNLAGEGGADLPPGRLAELVALETAGELTATQAKQVLTELVADPSRTAAEVAKEKGFEAMDSGALESVVDGIIADHPDEWSSFCGGDDKARKKLSGFFTGKVMQATKGQADGRQVAQILARRAADA
ncbi:MAG: Asp-tRNA(Asn)/Glu-tRNA(Gln) amidotransferase subunit GatB [Actinobacteria bacterium]|nr:Asp-tRNA(Asn)/Glu-tRNA(Gln) amidotransferase subunit GatB [Actinomycetota bacterium]